MKLLLYSFSEIKCNPCHSRLSQACFGCRPKQSVISECETREWVRQPLVKHSWWTRNLLYFDRRMECLSDKENEGTQKEMEMKDEGVSSKERDKFCFHCSLPRSLWWYNSCVYFMSVVCVYITHHAWKVLLPSFLFSWLTVYSLWFIALLFNPIKGIPEKRVKNKM